MTTFTEVSVKVDGEAAEAVAEVLRPFAYQESVVLEQMGDPDDPAPLALEPGVIVKIFIPQQEDNPELRHRIAEILYHLNRLYPVPDPLFQTIEETDWANAWKEHYHPFRIGKRFWIQPSWYDSEAAREALDESEHGDDIVLVLDPGMAFGTGLHPTTQTCIRALEQVVEPGERVLDVGTGSGILSIAAVRLGASAVCGVDTDELAVKAANFNAKQNNVSDKIAFWQGDLESVNEQGWDVVVVNILAPVIEKMLKRNQLMEYVTESGWLILSGIIDTQLGDLEKTIALAGGTIVRTLVVRDWTTVMVRTKASN